MVGDHGVKRIVDPQPLLERGSGAEVQLTSAHRIDAIKDDLANEVVTEPVLVRKVGVDDQSDSCRGPETADRFAQRDMRDPSDDVGGEGVACDRPSPKQRDDVLS